MMPQRTKDKLCNITTNNLRATTSTVEFTTEKVQSNYDASPSFGSMNTDMKKRAFWNGKLEKDITQIYTSFMTIQEISSYFLIKVNPPGGLMNSVFAIFGGGTPSLHISISSR